MKNIGLKSAILAMAGMTFASCGDFLEIYPLTMVYEDNYWTEKNDVDQIVTGCYTRMQDEDFLRRVFIWGEGRSDNVMGGSNAETYNVDWDEAKLMNENILSTNQYTDWSSFYTVINRCNLVIERAPQVAAIDPSYLETDVQATIAEVSALRALCYFYLVRAFKDVPYYTHSITNDEQPLNLEVTDGDQILRNLIADLQHVLPHALRAWPAVNGEDVSYGRITQYAIYALLADMSLWIGDYSNAARYADEVIKYKTEYFEQNYSSSMMVEVDGTYYPLIPDNSSVLGLGEGYNRNFCEGGSPESIFELDFSSSTTDNTKSNNMAAECFYRWFDEGDNHTGIGTFVPERTLWTEWDNPTLFDDADQRIKSIRLEGTEAEPTAAYVGKYTASAISFATTLSNTIYSGRMTKNDENWIFYRVSDMLLIKAEALLYQMGDDMTNERNDSLGRAAFELIQAVSDRSTGTPVLTYVSSKASLIDMLYDERRREFLFEGKRWFDLVRRSRQDGNTDYLVEAVQTKLGEMGASATSKLGNPWAVYWPYNYDEVRVNENLHQNPAYPDSDDNSSFESTTN